MSSITRKVTCNFCKAEIDAAFDQWGKEIICLNCGSPVAVPSLEATTTKQSQSKTNTSCPYCGGEIPCSAIKCRHCQVPFKLPVGSSGNTKFKCQKCKKLIPKYVAQGQSCPKCGAKGALDNNYAAIGMGVMMSIIFLVIISCSIDQKEAKKEAAIKRRIAAEKREEIEANKTPEQRRREVVESCFSVWDGSHRGLTAVLKNMLNDPRSYKHDRTTYLDKGNYLIVETTYRAKNAFGAYMRGSITAKVGLDGEVIEILGQD